MKGTTGTIIRQQAMVHPFAQTSWILQPGESTGVFKYEFIISYLDPLILLTVLTDITVAC